LEWFSRYRVPTKWNVENF